MKHYLLLLYLILLLPVFTLSQIDTIRFNKNYLKKYWVDTKEIVRSPVRWEKNNWQRVGLFALTTGALFFADEPVNKWVQDNKNEFFDNTSKYVFEPFGAEYTLAVCGALYGYGVLTKNRKSESTALLAVESFALASLFVRIPKTIFGRQRPDSSPDVSPFEFKGFLGGSSFPSGHTIAVFSVASVIANQYHNTIWVPVVSYSLAGLAGLSRIYDNRHWGSDVFVGAVMGIAIGNLVAPVTRNSRLSVIPVKMNNSAYGLKLAYRL